MKYFIAFILSSAAVITWARADILVVGNSRNDLYMEYFSKMAVGTEVIFCHQDSCKTPRPSVDFVIFRSSCSNGKISQIKRNFRKGKVTFAIESDSCRAGITTVIPTETAIKNAMSTMLCNGSEQQLSYAVACCWYKVVIGKDVSECNYIPDGIRKEVIPVLQMCGIKAAEHPGMLSEIDEHPYLPALDSQWKGKRVVFFGDSITDKNQIASANDVYWHMLEKLLGITPLVYGINGHQMSHILGQAASMEKEIGDNFDAIVIFAGTNDYNSSVPIGDWYTYGLRKVNDHGKDTMLMHRKLSKDNQTFKGRINTVLDSLKSHFPGKQIIMLTPIHRSWANFGGDNIQPDESFCNREGLYIDSYIESIKEASSVWSVPVIDLFGESGLMPGIASQGYLFRHPEKNPETGYHDLLHPNTEGHLMIALTVAYRMITIPCFQTYLPQ